MQPISLSGASEISSDSFFPGDSFPIGSCVVTFRQ
jgi:hypothetical protein